MATKVQTIIDDALREINVIAENQSASPEQLTQGLRKLNQMMEAWKSDSMDVGWFQVAAASDNAPAPEWTITGITLALAARLAPQYGTSLSGESAALLEYFINIIRRANIDGNLDNADMSFLPEGMGHWGNRYDITTDS